MHLYIYIYTKKRKSTTQDQNSSKERKRKKKEREKIGRRRGNMPVDHLAEIEGMIGGRIDVHDSDWGRWGKVRGETEKLWPHVVANWVVFLRANLAGQPSFNKEWLLFVTLFYFILFRKISISYSYFLCEHSLLLMILTLLFVFSIFSINLIIVFPTKISINNIRIAYTH